ncbi:MAG: OmpH family outer membrane protein [Candidatus Omnitrophota bacterium]
MKRFLFFLAALSLMCSFSFKAFSQEMKIGYVDIFEIFNEYDKTKEYDAKLEIKKKAVEKELEVKKEDIEKIQNKLSLLKEGEKGKEEDKITKKIEEYRELEREAFTDIKKERDEKMKEIVEDINKIVRDYAKDNNFSLVINENSVLYGEKIMDITSEILRISNKKYSKK